MLEFGWTFWVMNFDTRALSKKIFVRKKKLNRIYYKLFWRILKLVFQIYEIIGIS